ncbi:unnamed protein product [Mytilus edulis]|uniref:DZIP3-like HEPN domain-containing protein n=1 Tax=Mytilus edulis TaxID=6550 RepID=A0A8S3RWG4_MYTED|nr:unnamed protein product [Mytilus edulis]
MASALPSLEEENYLRMSLLLTGISPRAVRVLFDHEFAPECVPDSKRFDVTLMIILLRHLTSMTPPAGGYDRLPKYTETTLGADLARIKFYRNRLAHLDDAKIDHESFIADWNDVTSAICRVGGHLFQLECDNLKNKTLDQTIHEIMLEIKSSKDEIRELKQSLSSMKKDIELSQQDGIPRNVRETRASEHVMSWLSKCNIAVVTGSSGTGKSFLIHHIALELHRHKCFDIIPLSFVTAPSDLIHYKSKIRNQVFVIDDICGKRTIDVHFVNIWKDLTEKLKSVFQLNSVESEETISAKLLISCRLQVFNDSQFKCLKLFTENAFGLQTEPLCLLPDERLLMIKKYLTSEKINHVIEHLCDFDFFPLLFTSPIETIKEDIEYMIESDKNYQLCALILCILFEEGLKRNGLNVDRKRYQ